ncbi:l-psp endoribonuclease family [Fusarium heterosporum]|uniref:L-psp endoribonuclease family n=1 Tax=Fusarium heterosporum TaxID=42747 RepID=A0A8H5TS01_FUSHE|nr:l-psp endoribonuclease family [Fusarium heterosporum]
MSELKYTSYEGAGQYLTKLLGYSQSVRVGDKIEISGQGGWTFENETLNFAESQLEQIDQTFINVDKTLKTAGGKGWVQVYKVTSLHTEITPEVGQRMAENYKKWMPDHKVIWTQYGVKQLGAPEMKVEIEVVAYDPEGASTA